MKEKLKKLVLMAYPNVWFNMFSIMFATIFGYTQSFASILFVALYGIGAVTYLNNKPKTMV